LSLNHITQAEWESKAFEADRVAHLRKLAKLSFADKMRWVEVMRELEATFYPVACIAPSTFESWPDSQVYPAV